MADHQMIHVSPIYCHKTTDLHASSFRLLTCEDVEPVTFVNDSTDRCQGSKGILVCLLKTTSEYILV